jgi:ADP-ribosyl-[dinitrogen reductase] hydrolase
VGDALGAGIEFAWIEEILGRFGPGGSTGYVEAYGRRGAITDDTQMTLFTAEGLIRARVRVARDGIADVRAIVDHAYARWLATQGERSPRWNGEDADGWLFGIGDLHHRRSPGRTCLSALRDDRAGSVAQPINDSKGCGGVMRIAPVGLVGEGGGDPFYLGCELAALTHGHPSGYLAAGALAFAIAFLLAGEPLDAALDAAEARLPERSGHEETLAALRTARALAASGAEPGPETVATLGAGWVADEALAIGVYGALVARDYGHGVLVAANHSGDSDSTAAIAGSILGTTLGPDAIPAPWLAELELREEIGRLADDWIACFGANGALPEGLAERYPGW